MGFGYREFLFEPDGTMRHLSQRVSTGLVFGEDFLPQYAGHLLRHAMVILETENGRPARISRISASIWHFDYRGSVRDSFVEGAFTARVTYEALIDAEKKGDAALTSAAEARKAFEQRHRWEPSPLEINQIIHAIWPKDAGPVACPSTSASRPLLRSDVSSNRALGVNTAPTVSSASSSQEPSWGKTERQEAQGSPQGCEKAERADHAVSVSV